MRRIDGGHSVESELPWHGSEGGSGAYLRDITPEEVPEPSEPPPAVRKAPEAGGKATLDCPCDGCPWEPLCAEGLACDVFAAWVQSGKLSDEPRVPTAAAYRRAGL